MIGPAVNPYDRVTRSGLTRIARTVLGSNARIWKRKGSWQLGLEFGTVKRVLCEAPDVRALADAFLAPVRDYLSGMPRRGLQAAPGTTQTPEGEAE